MAKRTIFFFGNGDPKLPILSKVITLLFGHRTFTHILLFLVIVGAVLFMFVPVPAVSIGVLAGMVSHYILDAATKKRH
ncbi:metal-dependent hydrolase [Cytobacillus oceanisediminis]|uniref:metal-dependent hydrolase n=1 Tax=Cytobacillus oceanisediminis TaxID=665099 RepID=UPI00373648D5